MFTFCSYLQNFHLLSILWSLFGLRKMCDSWFLASISMRNWLQSKYFASIFCLLLFNLFSGLFLYFSYFHSFLWNFDSSLWKFEHSILFHSVEWLIQKQICEKEIVLNEGDSFSIQMKQWENCYFRWSTRRQKIEPLF